MKSFLKTFFHGSTKKDNSLSNPCDESASSDKFVQAAIAEANYNTGNIETTSAYYPEPDENPVSAKNAPINYLEAKILKFWNGKRTDYEIPPYYSESVFGRNVSPCLKKFISEGYIERSSLDKSIALYTIPDLKAVLSERGLKTSGKKQELINRLLENLTTEELEEFFPVGKYVITDKGISALDSYSILFTNDSHSLGLSHFRLLQEKELTPDSSDEDIIIRVLSQDIQKCYKEGDLSKYQNLILKTGQFFESISKLRSALECYILSYFIWSIQASKLNLPNTNGQSYYLALNIDKYGNLCGYSLKELESIIFKTITTNNPFGLGTSGNAARAVAFFKDSLSIS